MSTTTRPVELPPGGAVVTGEPPPLSQRPGRRQSLLSPWVWAPPIAVLGVVVGTWYLFSDVVLNPDRRFLLPPPHRVVEVGFAWSNLSTVLKAVQSSAKAALIGLSISIVLGMLFAILMSQGRWVERSFFPWAVGVQTVPILAVVPLIGSWFGYNLKSRVIVCVMISLFPIITNTLFGLQSTDRGHHDLFTLNGASRFTRLWKLQLPGALPAIFAGFRISAGLSVIGAIVGDFFFQRGQPGVGQILQTYNARLQYEQEFAAILMSCLLGVLVFQLFGLVGRFVTRQWYESGAQGGQ
jgi:NitT/TauT family transport system permease protein